MPKVSVIIPVYNCQEFIAGAIESVLKQTFTNYELIVVDDGSTDNTAGVVSRYIPTVRYIRQANRGPAGARNTGISNAKGEYLAFLDHDDAWLKDKLACQVPLLEENPQLGMVYSDTYIIDSRSFGRDNPGDLRAFSLRRPFRGRVLKELFLSNFIPSQSVLARKACFDQAGLFNPLLTPIEDYDRWLHIAALYPIDYIDRPLVRYRHAVACFRKDKILVVENTINTLSGMLREYPDLAPALGGRLGRRFSALYSIATGVYLSKGRLKKALDSFFMSIKAKKPSFRRPE